MSEQTSNKRIERRRFLGAIAAAGTTAAVAAAIAAPETAKPEGPQEGYRETAHIRRYYETARF